MKYQLPGQFSHWLTELPTEPVQDFPECGKHVHAGLEVDLGSVHSEHLTGDLSHELSHHLKIFF